MIHLNMLQEMVVPKITRMPAVEFSSGRIGDPDLHIHEIEISANLTIVLDEQQLIDLVEKALDALPDMRWDNGDEKGGIPA